MKIFEGVVRVTFAANVILRREAVAKLKDQIEVLQSEVIRLEDSKKRNDVEYASNLQRVTSESETR